MAGQYNPPRLQYRITDLLYTAGFIVNCSSTNFPLAVEPLPTLTMTPSTNVTAGTNVSVAVGSPDFSPSNFPIVDANLTSAPSPAPPAGAFLAYFHGGANISFSPIGEDNTTAVPAGLAGAVWAQVVKTNQSLPTLNDTISGVAMLNIPVPVTANNSFS